MSIIEGLLLDILCEQSFTLIVFRHVRVKLVQSRLKKMVQVLHGTGQIRFIKPGLRDDFFNFAFFEAENFFNVSEFRLEDCDAFATATQLSLK